MPYSAILKLEIYPSSFRMRAISTFTLEAGMSARWCRAWRPFRIRVNMSAIESVGTAILSQSPNSGIGAITAIAIYMISMHIPASFLNPGFIHRTPATPAYQLDLVTPGISPRSANWRKQRRHKSNFRRYPRGRPHRRQRFLWRILYLGFLTSFAIIEVRAKGYTSAFFPAGSLVFAAG